MTDLHTGNQRGVALNNKLVWPWQVELWLQFTPAAQVCCRGAQKQVLEAHRILTFSKSEWPCHTQISWFPRSVFVSGLAVINQSNLIFPPILTMKPSPTDLCWQTKNIRSMTGKASLTTTFFVQKFSGYALWGSTGWGGLSCFHWRKGEYNSLFFPLSII